MMSLGVGKLKDEVVCTLALRLTEVAAMVIVLCFATLLSLIFVGVLSLPAQRRSSRLWQWDQVLARNVPHGQTVTVVVQQQQLLHMSKQTLRGNDARTFEFSNAELELEVETRQKEGLENGVRTVKLTDEALEIPYSYWDGAGHRQVMQVRNITTLLRRVEEKRLRQEATTKSLTEAKM
ncbi:hypothetical protein Tco_0594050 [Tanacetum coccineum]